MKVLLDECVVSQAVGAVKHLLPMHAVHTVDEIGWTSKKDKRLIPDAVSRGYEVLVTRDANQLNEPDELDAIKKAGIHHVRYGQGEGLTGLGRSIGALVAAIPDVMDDLDRASGQRLVKIHGIGGGKRHDIIDPVSHPPKYWPR